MSSKVIFITLQSVKRRAHTHTRVPWRLGYLACSVSAQIVTAIPLAENQNPFNTPNIKGPRHPVGKQGIYLALAVIFPFCDKSRPLLAILNQNLQEGFGLKAEKLLISGEVCWTFPDGTTTTLTSPQVYLLPAVVFQLLSHIHRQRTRSKTEDLCNVTQKNHSGVCFPRCGLSGTFHLITFYF